MCVVFTTVKCVPKKYGINSTLKTPEIHLK